MPTPEELEGSPKRTEVRFTRLDEPIGKWYLQDGTVVTFRVVALKVEREEGSYYPDRNPVYHIQNKLFMSVESPQRLKFDVRNMGRDDDEDDGEIGEGDEETFRRTA